MGEFITVYDTNNKPVVINLNYVAYYRAVNMAKAFEVHMPGDILYLPRAEMQKVADALHTPMPWD